VEFRADRLDLDPRFARLELRGHVVVAIDRYRLTSDRISLERGPRGVAIAGGGHVAFCPCPNPPVSIGFRSALVAPPGDLFLTQPTVRVGGVPVLWLPYLWLRSPRRVGMLPLRVAWRGDDGLLLGSGIHLPIASATRLEVGAAGYVKGGAEIDVALLTPRTETTVRWDHLRGSSLAVDLRGATRSDQGASAAWSVESLRGGRALGGPGLLEEVALRQDRARAAIGWTDGTITTGVTASADALRGGPMDSVGAAGPSAHLGFGSAVGTGGTVDLDVGIATWAAPNAAATTLATHHGELRADTRFGPLLVGIEGRTRAVTAVDATAVGHTIASGAGAEIAMPFVKNFGPGASPTQHWITPFVSSLVGVADTELPSVGPSVAANGGFLVASAGVRSTLGQAQGSRDAVSVSARTGYLGEAGAAPRPVVVWTAAGRARSVAVHGEGVSLISASQGALVLSEVRLGPDDGPFVSGRAVGQTGAVPVLGRLLTGGWDAPWASWLGSPGWAAGGRVGVPWTRWLASSADLDYDVTHRTLLGLRGSLGYRHPCGCLAVALWAGHRVGRGEGPGGALQRLDSWLTVDLMPR
jgi:hypothetical protein